MLKNKSRLRLGPLAFIASAVAVFLLGACTNDVELDPGIPTTATTGEGDSPAESKTSNPVGDTTSSTSATIGDDSGAPTTPVPDPADTTSVSENQGTTTEAPAPTSTTAPDPGDSTGS